MYIYTNLDTKITRNVRETQTLTQCVCKAVIYLLRFQCCFGFIYTIIFIYLHIRLFVTYVSSLSKRSL